MSKLGHSMPSEQYLNNLIPSTLPFPWTVVSREPKRVVINEIVISIGLDKTCRDVGLAITVHAPEKMNGDDWVLLTCARPNQPCLLEDLAVARNLIFGSEHEAIYRIPKESEKVDPRQAKIWIKLNQEEVDG